MIEDVAGCQFAALHAHPPPAQQSGKFLGTEPDRIDALRDEPRVDTGNRELREPIGLALT